MSLLITAFIAVVISTLTLSLRGVLARLYTTDDEVAGLARENFILIAAIALVDSFVALSRGIAQGMALQKYAAVIVFVTFWGVVTPMNLILVLVLEKGMQSVWLMKLAGVVMSAIGNYAIILCTDWNKLTERIQQRLESVRTS